MKRGFIFDVAKINWNFTFNFDVIRTKTEINPNVTFADLQYDDGDDDCDHNEAKLSASNEEK